MAKFEGFIYLALVGSWMLLLPSARPLLKLSPRFWWLLAFCFLAALPLSACASRYLLCTTNRVGPVTPCTNPAARLRTGPAFS